MAGLNFLETLDDEQTANAVAVAEAAKKAGVDPTLAVAIAFQEGALRSGAPRGSSGEIGMMQVMPKTGKGMGYSEKDLADPTKNIEAGVRYLKEGLNATKNDPKLAAVYYNGGPGAVDALATGKDPDPRVFNYVKSLNGYGAFNAPVEVKEPTAADKKDIQAEASVAETDEQRDARIKADEERAIAEQQKRTAQLYGGGAGTTVSAYRAGKAGISDIARSTGRAAEEGRLTAQARAGVLGGQPPGGLPSGAPPAAAPGAPAPQGGLPTGPRQLGLPGTYPAATGPGSATFNYARVYGLPEIEAGKALGTGKAEGEVWDLLQKRQEGLNRVQQQMGGGYAENPRYGGIMTPQPSAGAGPRATYVQQAPTPPAPGQAPQQGGLRQLPPRQPISMTPQPPSGLQQVTQELKSLARPVVAGAKTFGRYAVPPLAVAGAAGELSDLEQEARKEAPDYTRMGLSGLSGLAGLAALYPPIMIPAGIVGVGSALANYAREKEKERGGQPIEFSPQTDYLAP